MDVNWQVLAGEALDMAGRYMGGMSVQWLLDLPFDRFEYMKRITAPKPGGASG